MGRKHALEADNAWLHNLLTVQLMSHCASVSSSVRSRFYLHSFGLDLAVDIDFKKRLIPRLRENSRGWQPRIYEVALISKVLRGQVSCVLMAFNPVTSKLKTATGIPAIGSVFPFAPYAWYSKRKEKRRKCTKQVPGNYYVPTLLTSTIESLATRGDGVHTSFYLGQHSVQVKTRSY